MDADKICVHSRLFAANHDHPLHDFPRAVKGDLVEADLQAPLGPQMNADAKIALSAFISVHLRPIKPWPG
jgi:hypothetical protein